MSNEKRTMLGDLARIRSEIKHDDGTRPLRSGFFCDVCGWAGADCICDDEPGVERRERGLAFEKRRDAFRLAAEHLAGLFEVGAIEVRRMTSAAETALGSFLKLADRLRELPDLDQDPRPERADPPIEGENGP